MFNRCSSLSDIKGLENWNVSNGNNFVGMFSYCSSLSDIKPLKNWKVSKENDLSILFYDSSILSDIKQDIKSNLSKYDYDYDKIF